MSVHYSRSRFLMVFYSIIRNIVGPKTGSRARLETFNRSKYGIYRKMASLENGINVDDRREHGAPTGTIGASQTWKRN